MKLFKTLWWIFLLMPTGCLFAQPAPTIVTTLQTTNPGVGSICVGCPIGSATATGGISFGTAAGTSISLSGGYLELQSNVPGTTTYRLYNNAGTLTWNGVVLAAGGAISGTTGKLSKFTAPGAVGDSICSESGTTITCVNTLSATTLTGTLSTASQPNITGVGTLTTAVWNATKIGLAYGGTNADLSGTGGTSQFLRQNSVGAAITVVRPAISDLSDGANVALLNAANTFTAAGTQTFTAANATDQVITIANSTSGTTARSFLGLAAGTTTAYFLATSQGYTPANDQLAAALAIESTGAGGTQLSSIHASGKIGFWTGATPSLRWGVNAAGDWTEGASNHIADSSGAPTIASGFGSGPSIAGTDYAFTVTLGSGSSNAGGLVTFGHTWSTIPVCTASVSNQAITTTTVGSNGGVSTTQMSVGFTTGTWTGMFVYVLCRGY